MNTGMLSRIFLNICPVPAKATELSLVPLQNSPRVDTTSCFLTIDLLYLRTYDLFDLLSTGNGSSAQQFGGIQHPSSNNFLEAPFPADLARAQSSVEWMIFLFFFVVLFTLIHLCLFRQEVGLMTLTLLDWAISNQLTILSELFLKLVLWQDLNLFLWFPELKNWGILH